MNQKAQNLGKRFSWQSVNLKFNRYGNTVLYSANNVISVYYRQR